MALEVLEHIDDYTPPYDGGDYPGSDGPLAFTIGDSPAGCAVVLGWMLA